MDSPGSGLFIKPSLERERTGNDPCTNIELGTKFQHRTLGMLRHRKITQHGKAAMFYTRPQAD